MTPLPKLMPMGLSKNLTLTNNLFGEDFIKLYLSKGFGKMNKNDIEVLFFHLLMKYSSLKGENSFAISTILKIPESKVKRLIYEAQLNYCDNLEKNMVDNLKTILQNAHFREKDHKIFFAVSDKMLRNYISSFLMENGHFNDTSFNSEIVVIHIETFAFLLEKLCYTEEESAEFVEKFQQLMPNKNKLTFSGIWKKIIESASSETGKLLMDKIFSNIFNLSNLIEILNNLIK
ncbi:MAG: hypothetical protein Q4A15_10965 [Prevotellaceae bacterium]|nr:hypothetical protein [Prevotellaceae bacterium]